MTKKYGKRGWIGRPEERAEGEKYRPSRTGLSGMKLLEMLAVATFTLSGNGKTLPGCQARWADRRHDEDAHEHREKLRAHRPSQRPAQEKVVQHGRD